MSGFVSAINNVEAAINLAIFVVLLAAKTFAMVNAAMYSSESYDAAGKLNKRTWLLLLVGAFVLHLFPVLSIFNLILTIVAMVYLADVRPALAGLKRR